jgi:hypothetical protein
MSGTGRYLRTTKPASAILDEFAYPMLLIHRPAFLAGFSCRKTGGYRVDNPHKLGTPARHSWRAGWDYAERLESPTE